MNPNQPIDRQDAGNEPLDDESLDDELVDMFGEGGSEDVKNYYKGEEIL